VSDTPPNVFATVPVVVPNAAEVGITPVYAEATWNKPLSVNVAAHAVVAEQVTKPTAGRGTNTPVWIAGLVKTEVPAVMFDVATNGAVAVFV
jgi:hypothetical protein